jgi:hypothetical protein
MRAMNSIPSVVQAKALSLGAAYGCGDRRDLSPKSKVLGRLPSAGHTNLPTVATAAEATYQDRTPAAVNPLRANQDRGTLLLERLRHSLDLLEWPQRAREEILCATAMRVL